MSGTSARLLSLLSLLQIPRLWPGSELAARLEVTPRTIRRDIERLRDLGYPVHATMGGDGGYRLTAGTAMPPLLLDDEEAVAIAVGLRTVTRHPVAGIGEASVRAMAKLRQVLPARLRHRVGALDAATEPPSPFSGPFSGPAIDPEVLTVIAAAAAGHERLRFAYESGDGVASRRLVEPYRLVTVGRRWYLLAFDNERDDWRIFRVERVREPRPTGVRVTPRTPPAEDAAAFVTARLYSTAPTYRAVATLRAPAEWVARRLGDAAGELEPVDAGSCRLSGQADTLEWLAFRLVTLGCEFEVHEPPELIAYLRELAARTLRAV
ncbi:YafY family transcriptional regulator [Actinomadura sp. ATCC 31491]|uniref:YafY family transcriptional regulator n=1 Tax=Actinomadura luzonensis TaxID=2805427 RepID=A0ABT0GAY1_9ACTN|nr:YafY family protein [Actinomadura luzonensis]MCK2221236.1 YafY family transcriptional regulator [Actinomadura luzonensis]